MTGDDVHAVKARTAQRNHLHAGLVQPVNDLFWGGGGREGRVRRFVSFFFFFRNSKLAGPFFIYLCIAIYAVYDHAKYPPWIWIQTVKMPQNHTPSDSNHNNPFLLKIQKKKKNLSPLCLHRRLQKCKQRHIPRPGRRC